MYHTGRRLAAQGQAVQPVVVEVAERFGQGVAGLPAGQRTEAAGVAHDTGHAGGLLPGRVRAYLYLAGQSTDRQQHVQQRLDPHALAGAEIVGRATLAAGEGEDVRR